VIRVDKKNPDNTDNLSRGKRSIALDLKQKSAQKIIFSLISKMDVLIDPYRPNVMERIGFGPDVLSKINPRLIYARLTGFGQNGPYSTMAGHDINYLAISGVLGELGRVNSPPTPPGNLLADFAGGGLMCAFGIILCLFERERSGKGQVIDCAMQDGALYLASFIFNSKLTPFWNKPRGENILDSGAPFYDTYQCKDNQWFSVGAVEPHFWKTFLKLIQLDTKINPNDQYDPNTWENTKKLLSETFLTKSSEEWQKIFDGSDACAVPVIPLGKLYDHPQNSHRKVLISKEDRDIRDVLSETCGPAPAPRLSRTPGLNQYKPLPRIGQHTEEILIELGLSKDQIQELIKSGVVYSTSVSRL